MKFLVVILSCVMLSGCFYQTVNQYDIRRAIKLCGSIENVVEISSYATGAETATCFDKGAFPLREE